MAWVITYIPGTSLHPIKHTPENSNSSQLELPAILLMITKWKGSSQENFKKTYGMTDDTSHQEIQGQVNPPFPESMQICKKKKKKKKKTVYKLQLIIESVGSAKTKLCAFPGTLLLYLVCVLEKKYRTCSYFL